MEEYEWAEGQAVFEIASRSWGGYPGRRLVIDKVTPTGRCQIASTKYGKDGRQIGNRYGLTIVPFTEEHEGALRLFGLRREADDLQAKIKWRDLSPEQLAKALPILRALVA